MDNPCRSVTDYYTLIRRLDMACGRLYILGRSQESIRQIWTRGSQQLRYRFHLPPNINYDSPVRRTTAVPD
jgi:hypothetical protein